MKTRIILIVILTALALSACSQSSLTKDEALNLTKEEILSVADQVDEIRVISITTEPNGDPKQQLMHRYPKGTPNFGKFIKELKNSADDGSQAQAIPNRYIVLKSEDKVLIKLGGYSGNGQFVWLELEGMEATNNYIYLAAEGKHFVN